MNIKQIKETAEKKGYEVLVDTAGPQYVYTITNFNFPNNPPIKTDRRGAELFFTDIDDYLHYCEMAGIEPF